MRMPVGLLGSVTVPAILAWRVDSFVVVACGARPAPTGISHPETSGVLPDDRAGHGPAAIRRGRRSKLQRGSGVGGPNRNVVRSDADMGRILERVRGVSSAGCIVIVTAFRQGDRRTSSSIESCTHFRMGNSGAHRSASRNRPRETLRMVNWVASALQAKKPAFSEKISPNLSDSAE